jgi:hypothetical protein
MNGKTADQQSRCEYATVQLREDKAARDVRCE